MNREKRDVFVILGACMTSFLSLTSNIYNFRTRCAIRFIVNDPNEHTEYEGKFYRHPDIGHRTLWQLSSSRGSRIYS